MVRGVWLAVALVLAACGGGGGGGGAGGATGNAAPAFTSSGSVSVAENTSGSFYTATASGGGVTFSLGGGADAARFSISAGGALTFTVVPDFEAPADANGDNIYLVTLVATNSAGAAMLPLTVTVTNAGGTVVTRRVATGFTQPLFLAGKGDGTGRVLVVQKGGQIRVLNPATGAIAATPFLDVSTALSTIGERGLLGLALAPDFATSRVFYVFLTNTVGSLEVRRYTVLASDPDRADTASADIILSIPHATQNNHNGGWLGFGQDGMLYVATGDGGGSGDPDLNGQNRNTLLGKILRIDPRTDSFPADTNRDYAIPVGNPFASGGGSPEIYVFGLRNPFRASFDRQTGHLYIGDVGQDAIEEIDLVRAGGLDAGANFGWNILEGTQLFAGGSTVGLTPPVAQYPQMGTGFIGNSVTGGYVYRGPIAQFRGQYVFADFIDRRIATIPVANLVQGTTVLNTGFTERTAQFVPDAGTIGNIPSFGEDDIGNLYIVDFDGEIFVLREVD